MRIKTTINGKQYQSRNEYPFTAISPFEKDTIDFEEVIPEVSFLKETPLGNIIGSIKNLWQDAKLYEERLNQCSQIPSFDRQQVLREEWSPTDFHNFFSIAKDGTILHRVPWQNFRPEVKFAPTFELAKEIVQIREGKWLPKAGDSFTCLQHPEIIDVANFDFHESLTCNYFPSPKQRDAFIEKNKPKEEKKTFTLDEVTIKITPRTEIDLAPRNEYGDIKFHSWQGILSRKTKIELNGNIREIYEDENGFLKIK